MICHHKQYARKMITRDQISLEKFDIMQCLECQLGWTSIKENFISSSYYPQEYYGDKNLRFHSSVEFLVKMFRKSRAREVMRLTKKRPGRILDIGCGRGLMLKELHDKGWDCYGTEHSQRSSQYARESLGLNVKITDDLTSCQYPSGFFDVVTLWHVLEHLPNPHQVLSEIKRILKSDGWLIIEVPHFTGWQAKIAPSHWVYLEAPRHYYHFSKKGLMNVLYINGFKQKFLSTCSLEYGIFGMIQSLLNLVVPIPNMLFIIMNNKKGRRLNVSRKKILISSLILVILIFPLAILGICLEFLAVAVGQGGVLKSVSVKKETI